MVEGLGSQDGRRMTQFVVAQRNRGVELMVLKINCVLYF